MTLRSNSSIKMPISVIYVRTNCKDIYFYRPTMTMVKTDQMKLGAPKEINRITLSLLKTAVYKLKENKGSSFFVWSCFDH